MGKREMCIKIINFNYDNAKGLPFSGGTSIFWEYEENNKYVYEYFNDVCPFRLFGLIAVTWLTVFYVYSWGMWYAEAAEIHQSTTQAVSIESRAMGAASGGGKAAGCVVS